MTTPARRKGDAWERAVADYLAGHGFPYAERAYGAGRPDDRGDIDGMPGYVCQVRNTKTIDLASAVDDAARQSGGVLYPLAIIKRRNRPTADGYVVMSLATFCDLLGEA